MKAISGTLTADEVTEETDGNQSYYLAVFAEKEKEVSFQVVLRGEGFYAGEAADLGDSYPGKKPFTITSEDGYTFGGFDSGKVSPGKESKLAINVFDKKSGPLFSYGSSLSCCQPDSCTAT